MLIIMAVLIKVVKITQEAIRLASRARAMELCLVSPNYPNVMLL
jgi:hypothetical protein